MMRRLPALACKSCSRKFRFPTAKNPHPQHACWPDGYRQLCFICPHCKRAYNYFADEIGEFDCPPPSAGDKVKRVIRIVIRCPTQTCDGVIHLFTLMNCDVETHAASQELVSSATGQSIICSSGMHQPLTGPLPRLTIRDSAYKDDLWEPLDP